MSYVDSADIKEHLQSNVVALTRPDGRPNRFRREKFAEIEPTGSEWLVKHFLPAQGVAIVAGPSTVGKSFVALYFCLRIARGQTILNHRSKHSGVIYVAAEGQNGMRKRIKALRDKWDVKTSAFQFIGIAPNLLDALDTAELIESLQEGAQEMLAEAEVPLGLIVIDTTAASMPGGNENSSEFMSLLLKHALTISQATGALVLLVGHTGKNEDLGVRGWSGQVGNSDAIIYLTSDPDDPALRLGVVKKLKDGEDGERFAYRLRSIHMGVDGDGDAITSAYPVFEDAPAAAEPLGKRKPGPKDSGSHSIILRAIGHMIDDGDCKPAPRLPGVRPGALAVDKDSLRERAIRMGFGSGNDNRDSVRKAFYRQIIKGIEGNRLRQDGDLIWAIQ